MKKLVPASLAAMVIVLSGSFAFAQFGGDAGQGQVGNQPYSGVAGQGPFVDPGASTLGGAGSPYGTQPYVYGPYSPQYGLDSPLGQGYGAPGYNMGQPYGGGLGSTGQQPGMGLGSDFSGMGTGLGYYGPGAGLGAQPFSPGMGSFGSTYCQSGSLSGMASSGLGSLSNSGMSIGGMGEDLCGASTGR